jgi:hypothetical protein
MSLSEAAEGRAQVFTISTVGPLSSREHGGPCIPKGSTSANLTNRGLEILEKKAVCIEYIRRFSLVLSSHKAAAQVFT